MFKKSFVLASAGVCLSALSALTAAYAGGSDMMAASTDQVAAKKWLFGLSVGGGPSLLTSNGSETITETNSGTTSITQLTRDLDVNRTQADGVAELYAGYQLSSNSAIGLAADYFFTDLDQTSTYTSQQVIRPTDDPSYLQLLLSHDYKLKLTDRMAYLLRYTYTLPGQPRLSIGVEGGISSQKVNVSQSVTIYDDSNSASHSASLSNDKNQIGAAFGTFSQFAITDRLFLSGRYLFNYVGKVDFDDTGAAGGGSTNDPSIDYSFQSSQKIYVNSLLFQIGYMI